ncbi:MAG TPA: prephenate dehydrogenase [Longimicrobiaceae bacterium]|nr:prephenate dehydrogenase [Longimicrobiaceae bacterium]
MREVGSVAVVGLGLIGGSLARDLAARGVRVLAHDRDPAAVSAALREGVVHAALGASLEGVEEVDLLVLAVPVSAAPAVLARVLPRLGSVRLVTDVGSTKESVCSAAASLGIGDRFVGSHPLAGSHRSGWSASREGLFRGARVFLTPTPHTREDALSLAREVWTGIGARPETLDATGHDRLLAWTSHLPQAAASALARALAGAGIPPAELGPGGRDATRLAASSPEMWTAIALDNAVPLSTAVEALHAQLGDLHAALLRRDPEALRSFFTAAREWADGEDAPPPALPAP